MSKPFALLFFFALSASAAFAIAASVTVEKIDDISVSGNLTAMQNATLTVAGVKGGPISFADISRVIFRPEPAESPESTDQSDQSQPDSSAGTSIVGGILQAVFGLSPAGPPAANTARPAPTTVPAAKLGPWEIRLAGNDVLHANVTQWTNNQLTLKLPAPLNAAISVPSSQVRQLWRASGEDRRKIRGLNLHPGAQDIALVNKNGNIVPVTGSVLGMEGDTLRFQFGDAERKIALNRVVAIMLAAPAADPPESFRQSFRLDTRDRLTGTWSGLDAKSALLTTPWGAALHLPLRNVYSINFLGGRLIYLSDLAPAKVTQTPFFGRVIPYRLDHSLDGGVLQMAGVQYAKGIAVHSRCILEYNLAAEYERFRCKLGFSQNGGELGRVDVSVVADDAKLYANPDLRGVDPPVDLDLNVANRQRLILDVEFGKDQDVGDRVIWANARLLRAAPQ